MLSPEVINLTGFLLALVLDLVTAAARVSLLNANLARLLGQPDSTQLRLNRTLSILSNLPRLQATFLLVLTVIRFLLAGLVLLLFVPRGNGNASLAYAGGTLALAGFIVFFLEWMVATAVNRDPEKWALRLTPFARLLVILMTPFVFITLIFRRESDGVQEPAGVVTESEVMNLVDAGEQEGVFEQGEREMIVSIFRLGDTLVREIMIPRIDILALDVETPVGEAIDALLNTGHSRAPVYKEAVDNILGLLYAKDLLRVWREGDRVGSLGDLLRPAYFVPEAKKVDELLAELQAQRIHMAIVVDEYGGVAGLATMEDIVEEIVGEIQDEYDQAEENLYQVVNESETIFLGRIDLDDFNELMSTNLPKAEADTLGGFIYSHIGRVPLGGESLRIDDLELTVEQVSGRRIRKVRARRASSPAAGLPQAQAPAENGVEESHADG